jgi:hypothetical protein
MKRKKRSLGKSHVRDSPRKKAKRERQRCPQTTRTRHNDTMPMVNAFIESTLRERHAELLVGDDAAAETPVEDVDELVDEEVGVVGVGSGETVGAVVGTLGVVLEVSVGVDVGSLGVPELPPVIVDPVIGIGVEISVEVVGSGSSPAADGGPSDATIENAGLALPESPIRTTM